MAEFVLRPSRTADRAELAALWRTAFGDPDDYIDSALDNLWVPENAVVAEADGKVVSAMYVLGGIELFPYRRRQLSAGYTYALATLPEYRGRGIGSAVYKAANDRALALFDAACVLPAEPGLYPFYENAGAKRLGCVREARIARSELAGHTPGMAARIPVLEYMGIRRQLLAGLPHADLPPEIFEHLEETGTEFFVLEHGLAAAENENGLCRILELLDPDTEDGMASVTAVARWCRAEGYLVRTPLFFDGPGQRRDFTLAVLRDTPDFPIAEDLWWGFGLD